jgi:Flp pilus assembly protein TadG
MNSRREAGITTVEFAIIGTALMVVMFAVIEFGRFLFTYSMLSEGTRRSSRVAAVCPVNQGVVASAAAFAGLPQFTASNVSVRYLDENGAPLASPTAAFAQIRYVRVQVTGYTYQMLIPFVSLSFTVPPFTSTMPAESLGVVNGVSTPC